jgi:hypothetical protein
MTSSGTLLGAAAAALRLGTLKNVHDVEFKKVVYASDESHTPAFNEHHGACRLPGSGGRAVVFGGSNGSTDAILFTPAAIQGGGPLVPNTRPRWSTLTLLAQAHARSLEFDDGTPPSPRNAPLMVGLTPRKFVVFGGVSLSEPHVRLTDAFLGEIVGAEYAQIRWRPVLARAGGAAASRSTARRAPFAYTAPEHAPTAYSATFMRTSDGRLLAVMPLVSGGSRKPSRFSRMSGAAVDTASTAYTRMVVTKIDPPLSADDATYVAVASEVVINVPARPSGAGGQSPWPATPLQAVRLVPLAAGYALGLTVPRATDVSERVEAATWLLSVARRGNTDLFTADGPVPSSSREELAQYSFVWTNLGSMKFAPPLRNGAIVFSSAMRLSPGARHAVVAVYGGSVIYEHKPVARAEHALYYATFSAGTTGHEPVFSWHPPMMRRHGISDPGRAPVFPVAEGHVVPFETNFDAEVFGERELTRKRKNDLAADEFLNFAIGWHGGFGKRDVPPATTIIHFQTVKKLVVDPAITRFDTSDGRV